MKGILKFGAIGCGGIIGLFVILAIIAAAVGGNKSDSQSAPASGQSQSTQSPKPAATAVSVPKVGDTITKGNWKYTVSMVDRQKSVQWSEFGNKTDAKGIWQIVHVQVENIGKQTYPINSWDFEIVDANKIIFKADSQSIMYSSFKKLDKPMDNYPPGVPAEIGLLFDVNPNATGLRLHLTQADAYVDLEQ